MYEWERDGQRQGGNETANEEGGEVGDKRKKKKKRQNTMRIQPLDIERALGGSCRQTKRYSLSRDGSQIVYAWRKQTRDKSVT